MWQHTAQARVWVWVSTSLSLHGIFNADSQARTLPLQSITVVSTHILVKWALTSQHFKRLKQVTPSQELQIWGLIWILLHRLVYVQDHHALDRIQVVTSTMVLYLLSKDFFSNPLLAGSGVRFRDCSLGRLENPFPNPTHLYTHCVAEVGTKTIAIYNVHPSRFTFVDAMKVFARAVQASIISNAFDAVVAMGDFNGRISEQNTSYQLLVDMGMANVLNPFNLANYTYPATRMRVPGVPVIDVDHIYVVGHVRVVQAQAREDLWQDELSDHIPVVATLEF